MIRCIDEDFPGEDKRRVEYDAASGQVRFVNCLWPRRFFAPGYEGDVECHVADIRVAREIGFGEIRRLYIATETGRCVIEPEWTGYPALRNALTQDCPQGHLRPWEDPRFLLVGQVVLMFAAVGFLIWLLL